MALTLRLDEKVALGDYRLGQFFHRVEVLGAVSADQVHFPERASPNDLDQLEVIQTDLLVRPE